LIVRARVSIARPKDAFDDPKDSFD
jgi:hypothetical protein